MKSYDETIASVFAKGDAIIAEKKRRMIMIRRFSLSASGICAALLVGVGIWKNNALKNPPDKNAGRHQSGIIAETTDEYTTATTAAVSDTTSESMKKNTSYTVSASFSAYTTVSITSSTSAIISSDTETQTASETSQAAVTQMTTASAVTSHNKTSVSQTETTSITKETTKSTAIQTTTTANNPECVEETAYVSTILPDITPVTTQAVTFPTSVTEIPESFPVLTSIRYDSLDFEGVETTYSSVLLENVPIINGNYLGSGTIHGTNTFSNKNVDIQASVWTVHNISKRFALAANAIREGKYTVFLNEYYSCQTFGELLNDIDAQNELELGWVIYKHDKITEYKKANPRYIYDLLAKLSDAPCVPSAEETSNICLVIAADMPVIERYSAGFDITANGYIITHFTSSEQYFYIGRDKMNELINELT